MTTVDELIQKLQSFPRNAIVVIWIKDDLQSMIEAVCEDAEKWDRMSALYLTDIEREHTKKCDNSIVIIR